MSLTEEFTLDQMRVFVAVAETGSFSAAARRLGKAQSAVSYAMQSMETQIGMLLFDRAGYRPVLTPIGGALLPRVRRILEDLASFSRDVTSFQQGFEPRLSVIIEKSVPTAPLLRSLSAFHGKFPTVEIDLRTAPLTNTFSILQTGAADIGVILEVPAQGLEGLEFNRVGRLDLVLVAASSHPLATTGAPLQRHELEGHVQLLLSAGGDETGADDWGGYSMNRWRTNDLQLRHNMILDGLAWGSLPRHQIQADIKSGRLVALTLDRSVLSESPPRLHILIARLRSKPLGPAAAWLYEDLRSQSFGDAM